MNKQALASTDTLKLKPFAVKSGAKRVMADRGTILAPENRRSENSRVIEIPILRLRPDGGRNGTALFHLAGGPGNSNLGFRPPAQLLERNDVVLVGYRGVDGESRLDSAEVRQAMRKTDGDLLGEAARERMGLAVSACVERFQEEGFDLTGYTVEEVVEDIEAARRALGYERIHLLSESYGTRVALMYCLAYPERVHRSVMMGVNPPGRFIWEAEKIDEQLDYLGRLLTTSSKQEGNGRNLHEAIRKVNQSAPKRWLLAPIDIGKVKVASFAMLFRLSTAAMVVDTYLAAAQGDPSGLAMLTLAYNLLVPGSFVWGDFLAKAFSADYRQGKETRRFNQDETAMGSPLSDLFWPHAHRWPIEPPWNKKTHAMNSEVETLIVSGSIDFSTPAEYAANELLPMLRKGRQVILAEMGHVGDLWGLQPDAMQHLVGKFLENGEVDESRFYRQEMGFETGWKSLPRLANAAAGAATLGLYPLAKKLFG